MSFRILVFDTSTEICSVALMIDGTVSACCGIFKYQHEKQILLMIDRLLLESNITLESLDCLAFCRGPGSFMGVRVGISVAQGLSLGVNLPLVELSSLEILAQGIWRVTKADQILATINAKSGALYLACYSRQSDNIWFNRCGEMLITPVELSVLISKLTGKWVLVGTGWQYYPILLSNSIFQISFRKILFPSAQDMLPLAVRNWNKGDLITADQIQPIYLSKII